MPKWKIEAEVTDDQLERLKEENVEIKSQVEIKTLLQINDVFINKRTKRLHRLLYDDATRTFVLYDVTYRSVDGKIDDNCTLESLCEFKVYTLRDMYLEEIGPYLKVMQGWVPNPDTIILNVLNNLPYIYRNNKSLYHRIKVFI